MEEAVDGAGVGVLHQTCQRCLTKVQEERTILGGGPIGPNFLELDFLQVEECCTCTIHFKHR